MALAMPVEKGWRVVMSRVYHVRDAAREYAEHARKAYPDGAHVAVQAVIGIEGERKELQR